MGISKRWYVVELCLAAAWIAAAAPVPSAFAQAPNAQLSLDDIDDSLVGYESGTGASTAQPQAVADHEGVVEQIVGRLMQDPTGSVDTWLTAQGLPSSTVLIGPAVGVAVALVLWLSLLRGAGDLKVAIDYPSELRGTFRVSIRRRRKSWRRPQRTNTPAAARRAKQKAGTSSRRDRHLVSRETDFHRIRRGRWFAVVDGFLQPPDDETVIDTHHEIYEVLITRGRTTRLDVDLRPRQALVDVKVTWDRKPVAEALVAWRGLPHTLRYARGGPVRLASAQGNPVLVVGSGDRVAEIAVDVASFGTLNLEVDLADRSKVLFSGCPPAVEPYVHADFSGAARALERDGQQDVANLVLARVQEEQGFDEAAARHYAGAGRHGEAAEVYRRLGSYTLSAEQFALAEDLASAAEMYRSAGELVRAGESFTQARRFDSAAACFEQAGDVARWCDALERDGRPVEAARIALDRGERSRAIRSLQLLGPQDEGYVEAGNLLVDVLQSEGHLDLAAEKIEEVIRSRGADSVPLDTCDRLAGLFEADDQHQRALDVLEIIRRRDASYDGLAARMEEVRKKLQRERQRAQQTGAGDLGGFRYEILEEIGRGGMGIVFKARDRRLGRIVALKRLPDNLRNHPNAVEFFLREARASARLNHPNIVTVHDAGQEGETFYITMELLEGLPLNELVKRHGVITARDTAKLGLQACRGLQFAHECRIVHRDIKTGNFFFTKERVLKIMDFGLAKMVEEVRKQSTMVGGTPYYMAPEQAVGGAVDHRADLYALGVTFFELLTGGVPFREGDVVYHHRHTAPPDPRERRDDVPDAFAELVLELMAKEPADRPETAAKVGDRLNDILAGLG